MKNAFGIFPKKCVPMLLLLLFLTAFTISVSAQEISPAIYVETETPDENGLFDVTVSFENVDFLAYQIALKYNTSAAIAVCEDGSPAVDFADFALRTHLSGLSNIGETLDTETGLFAFTQYCMPGTSEDKMIHIKDKTEMYRFSFKKISDEDMGLDIASIYNGEVYSKLFPDGAAVTHAQKQRYTCKIVIKNADNVKELETAYYMYSELYPENFTKEQRLAGTVYIVKDDYAAAVDGALKAIDSENKNVVPYVKDGVQYFPLRFICESLGLNVDWDAEQFLVTVTDVNGEVNSLYVNTEDRAEIVYGRTMVSAELLCKLSGVRIYEYYGNAYVVYNAIPEWNPDRQAEKDALSAMQYVLMPLFRMFI